MLRIGCAVRLYPTVCGVILLMDSSSRSEALQVPSECWDRILDRKCDDHLDVSIGKIWSERENIVSIGSLVRVSQLEVFVGESGAKCNEERKEKKEG